jgi:hypothetical protein
VVSLISAIRRIFTELNTIRNKMKEFLEEFMAFFGGVFETWKGDTNMFLPTKRHVEKCFN